MQNCYFAQNLLIEEAQMKRYVLVPLDRRRFNRGNVLGATLSALTLAVVAGGIGAWLGSRGLVGFGQENHAPAGQQAQDGQRTAEVAANPSQCTDHIDFISSRVGAMQGELLRLKALGERLVEITGLDKDEFDFSSPAPQGGPDTSSYEEPAAIDALAEELAQVLSDLDDRERKLTLLEQLIMERHLGEQASAPSGWPVRSGYITSTYGFRRDPFHGRSTFHKGVDFAGARGAPVVAVAEGVVTFSGKQSGYGNLVEIRHKNGLVTRYGHCQARFVKEGDQIAKGQTIATLGSTGRSTGPHVHFEVMVGGKQVDPMQYIDQTNLAADTETSPSRSPSDG
jgi:murein DD-endopeptidase MepM/ murein hydrolase activator NlpD